MTGIDRNWKFWNNFFIEICVVFFKRRCIMFPIKTKVSLSTFYLPFSSLISTDNWECVTKICLTPVYTLHVNSLLSTLAIVSLLEDLMIPPMKTLQKFKKTNRATFRDYLMCIIQKCLESLWYNLIIRRNSANGICPFLGSLFLRGVNNRHFRKIVNLDTITLLMFCGCKQSNRT